jgi:hypothetical protein
VLAELRRPATTQELDALVGRHPNTVRVQLTRPTPGYWSADARPRPAVTEAAGSIARANHARTAIVAPRDVESPGPDRQSGPRTRHS